VTGIWIANVIIALVAVGFYVWYTNPAPAAAQDPAAQVPDFLKTPLVTLTPKTVHHARCPAHANARPLRSGQPLPRPKRDAHGGAPANVQVIGNSVENRPLEVFRYGKGPCIN